jgi:Spy/CpxP family protein refolding chaperone
MPRHRVQWIAVAVGSFAVVGCQQGGSGGQNATASAGVSVGDASPASSDAGARAARGKSRMFARHGGIGSSLFHAAHELDLTQAQLQALDKIEAALKADDESIRAAMTTFRADLIAGVKPGRLDVAKLTVDYGLVDKAIADHQSREAEALESLHTLLDATRRASLVASVRARVAERESRMGAWMKGKETDGGPPDSRKRRLERLTADLSLEPDQQKRVDAILAKARDLPNGAAMQSRWEERKNRTEGLLTTFAGDAFDAKTLDLTVLPGKTAHEALDHMVTFYAQLLPILYANQRDKLAESLDRPFGGGGHPGMPGAGPARTPADDMAFPFAEPVEPSEEPPAPAR